MDQEPSKPYVPPFVRRAMKDATEEEILAATENLRQYMKVMYRFHREIEVDDCLDVVSSAPAQPGGERRH